MNEALQLLASKLGTTTEFIYSVMLSQAPISGAVDLAQYAVIVFTNWLVWRKRKAIVALFTDDNDYLPLVVIGTVIGTAVLVTLDLCVLFSIEDTATAFINPKYWALKHILSAVKS